MLRIQRFMGDQDNFSVTKILYLPPLSLNGGELNQMDQLKKKRVISEKATGIQNLPQEKVRYNATGKVHW